MLKSKLISILGENIVKNGLPGALRRKLIKVNTKEKGDPDPEIESISIDTEDLV